MKIWENLKQKKEMQGSEMFVVVGLGNPGREYEKTKHNVGFAVVDSLGKNNGIEITKFKHKALVGDGNIGGKRVLLVKPQTFMNLSGESIQEVLRFYKVPVERFMVVYDDVSLPVGALRIREKGSAGGHNGIKSIISHLGSDEFLRFKVGIGNKPNGWDLADYVLAPFTKDDLPLMESAYDKTMEAVELILKLGRQAGLNHINQKVKPKALESETENE